MPAASRSSRSCKGCWLFLQPRALRQLRAAGLAAVWICVARANPAAARPRYPSEARVCPWPAARATEACLTRPVLSPHRTSVGEARGTMAFTR